MKRTSPLMSGLVFGVPLLIVTACSASPSAPAKVTSSVPGTTTTAPAASGELQHIDTMETARDLMESLAESDAVVKCGSEPFIDVPVGGTFDCTMRSSTKNGRIVVTVGENGGTSWELVESK